MNVLCFYTGNPRTYALYLPSGSQGVCLVSPKVACACNLKPKTSYYYRVFLCFIK